MVYTIRFPLTRAINQDCHKFHNYIIITGLQSEGVGALGRHPSTHPLELNEELNRSGVLQDLPVQE